MDKQEKTKYKLALSIKELMKTTSLDRISVSDITTLASVSRQTFYRLFIDKYDLVNWYFEKQVQDSFKEMGVSLTLKEALVKKFSFIQKEYVFFKEAFNSHDANSLIRYDYEYIYKFYRSIIIQNKGSIDDKLDFELQLYCHGSIQMTVNWVNSGMKTSIDEITTFLVNSMSNELSINLSNLQKL